MLARAILPGLYDATSLVRHALANIGSVLHANTAVATPPARTGMSMSLPFAMCGPVLCQGRTS